MHVTSRQRQVFEAWCAGEPVADTCDRLRISAGTLLEEAIKQRMEVDHEGCA
jgi:DNA-binding NarL/FixJ family response regulator